MCDLLINSMISNSLCLINDVHTFTRRYVTGDYCCVLVWSFELNFKVGVAYMSTLGPKEI